MYLKIFKTVTKIFLGADIMRLEPAVKIEIISSRLLDTSAQALVHFMKMVVVYKLNHIFVCSKINI